MNFHPPAPKPHTRPLNAIEFVWTMARNPLAIWGEGAYREPVIVTEWLGKPIIVISDPAAIRHVMVDNAKNYAMQPLRQRVLRPILRDGLLTAEGELWKRTRRSLAPVFAPRNTTGLATAMLQRSVLFADGLERKAGQTSDIAVDMTLLTFDILQATLFTGDIAGDPQEFAAARARDGAARSADAAARGRGPQPLRDRGQHHHLHRRRARNDGAGAGLDTVPAQPGARRARQRRSRDRRARFFRPDSERLGRPAGHHPRGVRGGDASLSAGALAQPRGS